MWIFIKLALTCFFILTSVTYAGQIQIGSSYVDVRSILGDPDGELSTGSKKILTYGEGQIVIKDGVVESYSPNFNKHLRKRQEVKAEVQKMRDAGLVNHKGEWITREESQKLKIERARQEAKRAPPVWFDDFVRAAELAEYQDKKLLLNFTGSDWCGWCLRLDEEVFSKKEFLDYARSHYVLVKLDFPRRTKLPERIRSQNEILAKELNIRGYPTIVVLNSDRSVYKRGGYVQGGPKAFLNTLR